MPNHDSDTFKRSEIKIIDMLDCDGDCDGTDASRFKIDFGRSTFNNPCVGDGPCNGDFDCDGDCDGTDAAGFKFDFGRSPFNAPCPACVVDEWCVY